MLSTILNIITETWDVITSMLRRTVRWRILLGADPKRQQLDFKRYVVFCAYETQPRPDLRNLMRLFKEDGFGIVVVSSNNGYEQYRDLADAIVRVAPLGRDFTNYRQGYLYLAGDAKAPRPEAVVFVNDSVWFFEKYQADIVARISGELDRKALVAGTMVLDQVPHVSGWLWGLPVNGRTHQELMQLFRPSFARKSRRYHIQNGEHKILPTLRSTEDVVSIDERSPMPAVANGYVALMQGSECFYVKADASMRTNSSTAHLHEFLECNAGEAESRMVLRWLADHSGRLLQDAMRRRELQIYQEYHFSGGMPPRGATRRAKTSGAISDRSAA
jgi:hypothetical protein